MHPQMLQGCLLNLELIGSLLHFSSTTAFGAKKEIKTKSGVIQENYGPTEDGVESQLWAVMLCPSQLPTASIINNQ